MQMKEMQKIAALVNTVLMGLFILGLNFFRRYEVTYMVYHCIPTIILFLPFYYLIYKRMLHLYVILLYINMTAYMAAANVCLGYNTGFLLYCMSLIPLTFYMEYMSYQLHTKKMGAMWSSCMLAVVYLVSTVYVILNGPIYEIDVLAACVCHVINAISVFCFLIGYSNLMIKLVMGSEQKLTDMANTDRLTGLFNRHYIMTLLDKLFQSALPGQWIAMVDIDDFKDINDTYGHSCGDYVLTELAKIMQEICQECTVSRWGGEEFLIISDTDTPSTAIIEQLRQKIERTELSYNGQRIAVTVTIGVSYYQAGQSMNSWIQSADSKLYEGKTSGKNQVVY